MDAFRQILDLEQPSLAFGALSLAILACHIHAQAIGCPRVEILLDDGQEVGQNNTQGIAGTCKMAGK